MFRVPTTWLAVVLIGGAAPVKDPQSPPAKVLNVASARQQPSPNEASPYDAEAERELFDLANKARAQAGVAPLQMDDGHNHQLGGPESVDGGGLHTSGQPR